MVTKKKKPTLIHCGKHFIAPQDVRCITQVKKDLYVVRFFSEPNPEYPCWLKESEIGLLLEMFDIIESDE